MRARASIAQSRSAGHPVADICRDGFCDYTCGPMPNVLILTEVQESMRARYKAMLLERFPQLTINVVGHHDLVGPFIGSTGHPAVLRLMSDHVVRDAPKLKWIQSLGTGVDNIVD